MSAALDQRAMAQTGRREGESEWGDHMRTSRVPSRGALAVVLIGVRQPSQAQQPQALQLSINTAGIPAIKDPLGLTKWDGNRLDGQTLMPWALSDGRTLLWDAAEVGTVTGVDLFKIMRGRASQNIEGKGDKNR